MNASVGLFDSNTAPSGLVVLVDEQDNPLGTCEKMEAHRKGYLHRAFSVFLFDTSGRLLLQQRALEKYHCGGLWSNTCCSHPYPNEQVLAAATRRLQEELGFTTPLTKAFDFVYRAELENGLFEHEFDHVFIGTYEGLVDPSPAEVMGVEYVHLDTLAQDMEAEPERFTPWLHIAFPKVVEWWQLNHTK